MESLRRTQPASLISWNVSLSKIQRSGRWLEKWKSTLSYVQNPFTGITRRFPRHGISETLFCFLVTEYICKMLSLVLTHEKTNLWKKFVFSYLLTEKGYQNNQLGMNLIHDSDIFWRIALLFSSVVFPVLCHPIEYHFFLKMCCFRVNHKTYLPELPPGITRISVSILQSAVSQEITPNL